MLMLASSGLGGSSPSRLSSLSANAVKSLFDIESDDTLITLITIKTNPDIGVYQDIRLTDTAVSRISETADEVVYGVTSNSLIYQYLPLQLTLPNDDAANAPRCQLVLHDVTRYIVPVIRGLTGPPEITLQLVLLKSPDAIEVSYSGFKLTNISYNASTVSGDLSIPSLEVEPFPMHSFVPAYFPGLF